MRFKDRSRAQGRKSKFLSLFCTLEAQGLGDSGNVVLARLWGNNPSWNDACNLEKKGPSVPGTNAFEQFGKQQHQLDSEIIGQSKTFLDIFINTSSFQGMWSLPEIFLETSGI